MKQLFSLQCSLPQGCVSLRWPDSRESIQAVRASRLILANRFGNPELTPPFFCESRFGGHSKITNRSFQAIRARIASKLYENSARLFCESIRVANRFARIATFRVANRRAIKRCVSSIQISSSPKVLDLDMVASAATKREILTMATLLCGWVLSERALRLLLIEAPNPPTQNKIKSKRKAGPK